MPCTAGNDGARKPVHRDTERVLRAFERGLTVQQTADLLGLPTRFVAALGQWFPRAVIPRRAGGDPPPRDVSRRLALLHADPWAEEAVCPQTDPELFFPEKGGSTREAKRICADCPVRAECLETALERDEWFGIWGGLSERERRAVRRQRRGNAS